MTDQTAPERVWVQTLQQHGRHLLVAGANAPHENGASVEYIRAAVARDELQAAVAAACQLSQQDREAITDAAYVEYSKHQRRGGACGQTITEWDGPESWVAEATAKHIAKADALSALDRVKAEARERCIEIARKYCDKITAEDIAAAIRAEADATNENAPDR